MRVNARFDAEAEQQVTYLAEVTAYAFETSAMQSAYETYSVLIEPYATTERSGYSFLESANDFYSAVAALKSHAAARAARPAGGRY